MNNIRGILNCPVSKWICWLLRNVPVTTVLVILLCVIHAVGGDTGDLRTKWGQEPEKPLSWITHAFIHTNFGHIAGNLFVFIPSSALIELYMGTARLTVIVLYTAVTAGVITGIAVPEYWETRCNPVGISAAAYATLALGTYIGTRIVTIQGPRIPAIKTKLEGLQNLHWPTIGTVAGMTAAGIWLALALVYEWNSEDSAARVAHSFGMISGVTMATLLAITAGGRKKPRLGTSATVLAIVVIIVAIVSVIPSTPSEAPIICERPAAQSAIDGE